MNLPSARELPAHSCPPGIFPAYTESHPSIAHHILKPKNVKRRKASVLLPWHRAAKMESINILSMNASGKSGQGEAALKKQSLANLLKETPSYDILLLNELCPPQVSLSMRMSAAGCTCNLTGRNVQVL